MLSSSLREVVPTLSDFITQPNPQNNHGWSLSIPERLWKRPFSFQQDDVIQRISPGNYLDGTSLDMSLATEWRPGKPINNCSQEPQILGWELTLSHEKQPHPRAVCEFCWWRCHIDPQPVHLFHTNSGMSKSFHASVKDEFASFVHLVGISNYTLKEFWLVTSWHCCHTSTPIIKSSLWERKSAPSNYTYFPLDRSSRETNSSITNFDR